jgi:cytochrome b involved in lipid metabolism
VLDDLVLNVRFFMYNHPGGKFVIEQNIGRNISKFFYGGYIMENYTGQTPFTHSNIARL